MTANTSSKQWPIKRLRYLTSRSPSDSSRALLAHVSEASFLPMEAIGEQGQLDLSRVHSIENLKMGYSQFFDGDVVIAKITPCFENGKGALIQGTLGGVGFGTTELHVLTPDPELDGRFLYYVTVDPRFRKLGESYMTGAAGQQRVPEDFVRDFQAFRFQTSRSSALSPTTSTERQRGLDALVAEKERLIELLAGKAHRPHQPRRHQGPRSPCPPEATQASLGSTKFRRIGKTKRVKRLGLFKQSADDY